MLTSLLIVFREVLEAGLVLGIVLAATQGIANRAGWIAGGVAAGLAGAALLAGFAGQVALMLDGNGQELFTAAILVVAVLMLAWHNIVMATHGRALAQDLKALGRSVAAGTTSMMAMATVVAVAFLREGAEVVLFLYGVALSGHQGAASLAGGIGGGLIAGAGVAWVIFRGLLVIPARHLFAVLNGLIAALAAGMAGQSAAILAGIGFVPRLGDQLWDTSSLIRDDSLPGRVLRALIGYSDRPSGVQVLAFVATLAVFLAASRMVRSPARPRVPEGKPMLRGIVMAAALAGLCVPAHAEIKLKIGVLNDRSGIYSDLSGEGSVIAARMAVEDFKAADKGLAVEVVSADHQNKPDIGSNIARQWYDQDGVDAIFDVPTSSVALAVSQITREKNKVFMDSGAGASAITGQQCSPNTVLWTYDTYSLAKGTAGAMVKAGGKSWFFLTADYAFGHSLETDAAAIVKASGGEVLGSVNVPFPSTDVSSFLLQAQGSGANVVGLANAGGDTINAIKQASEFGLAESGQKLAGLLVFISDVHALGLKAAQGLLLTEAFYWDLNDGTRAWSKRFGERDGGKMPTMVHAGVYASVLHYLEAVDALKGKDTAAVMAKMKEMPTDDALFGKGSIRADGRTLHDMYLFEVKKPEESKAPYDYYKLISTIPADEAFRPLGEGGCPLVK